MCYFISQVKILKLVTQLSSTLLLLDHDFQLYVLHNHDQHSFRSNKDFADSIINVILKVKDLMEWIW